MSDLKEYRFDELYQMASGISTSKTQAGHGAPFVSFKDIYNNPILPDILTEKMDTSEEEQKKYSVKKGDIFLTRTSEVLDELAMSSVAVKDYPCATFSGFAKRLRPIQDNLTYDKFMAFYLRSIYFRNVINAKAVMTLRASFNERIFSYIKLLLPDYDTQVKIGDLFYNIECKIRNNNKINVELESIAKTIYDYWFLQFEFPNENGKPYKSSGGKMVWSDELKREIPESWEIGTLEDVGEIVAGGTPSTEHPEYYCKNGIAWITPNDLSNSNDKYISHGERDISDIGLINSSAKLMPKGTVLLTSRAPIGYIGIAINEVCTNQGFKSIVPNKKFGSEFIYYTIQKMIEYLKSLGTGSTFMEISKNVVAQVKIVLPEEPVVNEFEKITSEISGQHRILEEENRELISLRDFLLPLLMNGQVGFKD